MTNATRPYPFDRTWSIGQAAGLACLLEASAPKLGNVHPGQAFEDMHFEHFLAASLSIQASFDRLVSCGLGELVLQTTQRVWQATGCNTSLGTILLLAPLAKAKWASTGEASDLQSNIQQVLQQLSSDDARLVYQAIRESVPGGLGRSPEHDVASPPPPDLLDAMRHAPPHDAVARQYTIGFADLFERLVPWLGEALHDKRDALQAICSAQLRWLAHEPDGLIVRKLGAAAGCRVQEAAQAVLAGRMTRQSLDALLRSEGHRWNPGTTADLIAAANFILLCDG